MRTRRAFMRMNGDRKRGFLTFGRKKSFAEIWRRK